LYNITADPFQINNFSDSEPDLVKQCRLIMKGWVTEQKAKPGFRCDPIVKVLKERRVKIPEDLL
jgi:hypothetical protein